MKIIGIDLAGNPRNDSGLCVLEVMNEKKIVKTFKVKSDEEILEKVKEIKPEIIAIDAPLTYSGATRKCDLMLREYGALPLTLPGMDKLARRGSKLRRKIQEAGFKAIEVFSTASAKILGLYDKNEKAMQKKLLEVGIRGDLEKRFLSKDEIDAIFAALTGFLYVMGDFKEVGNKEGKIIIPKI